MPLNPIKYGTKLYALCEAETGYACSIILYNVRKGESNLEMISRLTENFKEKNHHVYMDNFYTSTKVFENLKLDGIFCCKTMRENSGGPKRNKILIKTFSKAEGIVMNNANGNYIGLKIME
jgi:hypothetical protein